MGASNSWNPQGLSRPVQGLLYLLLNLMASDVIKLYFSYFLLHNPQPGVRNESGPLDFESSTKYIVLFMHIYIYIYIGYMYTHTYLHLDL